jgi:hypothetical protein
MDIKIGWAGICIALLVLAACGMPSEPFNDPEHTSGPVAVSIRIVQENSPARTVLPDTSVSSNYELWGTRSEEEAEHLASFTDVDPSPIVEIGQGTWNFTLKAFNTNSDLILQGSISDQLVASDLVLEFSLSPLPVINGGTGSVHITISLPPIPVITKADVYIENELHSTLEVAENSIVYTDSEAAVGNYLIRFDLKSADDTVLTRISEMAVVRANLLSPKTITVLLADLQGPTAVSLTAMPSSASTVSLSWDPIEGASSYQIYQAESAAGPYTYIDGTDDESHTCSSLSGGTVYYYQIYALDGDGHPFEYSLPVSALTYPGVPTGVQASGTWNTVELRWDRVTGATGYRVYCAENSFDGPYEPVTATSDTAYTEIGLTSGRTYYYRVSAYNASGEGEQSAPVPFSP